MKILSPGGPGYWTAKDQWVFHEPYSTIFCMEKINRSHARAPLQVIDRLYGSLWLGVWSGTTEAVVAECAEAFKAFGGKMIPAESLANPFRLSVRENFSHIVRIPIGVNHESIAEWPAQAEGK